MYEIKIKCFTASVSLFNSHTSYRVSLRWVGATLGADNESKEQSWNKKFLYHFEILAVVFELEKKMSKPICG